MIIYPDNKYIRSIVFINHDQDCQNNGKERHVAHHLSLIAIKTSLNIISPKKEG
jgi:hypothetical protein